MTFMPRQPAKIVAIACSREFLEAPEEVTRLEVLRRVGFTGRMVPLLLVRSGRANRERWLGEAKRGLPIPPLVRMVFEGEGEIFPEEGERSLPTVPTPIEDAPMAEMPKYVNAPEEDVERVRAYYEANPTASTYDVAAAMGFGQTKVCRIRQLLKDRNILFPQRGVRADSGMRPTTRISKQVIAKAERIRRAEEKIKSSLAIIDTIDAGVERDEVVDLERKLDWYEQREKELLEKVERLSDELVRALIEKRSAA